MDLITRDFPDFFREMDLSEFFNLLINNKIGDYRKIVSHILWHRPCLIQWHGSHPVRLRNFRLVGERVLGDAKLPKNPG
jgi:hypothetical protein